MSAPLPGMTTGRTVTPRNIFFDKPGLAHFLGGRVHATLCFDGANTTRTSELREGTIMARVTSSLKWCPCLRTQVTPAGGATAQAIPVVDARHFQVGMKISVGADTGKTISAVNYSTNTITVSDAAFVFANDEAVIATHSTDGSTSIAGAEIARGVLAEVMDAYDVNTRANVDKFTGKIVDQGNLIRDNILGDLTSILAATDYLGLIRFYDDGVWIG